MSQRAVLVQFSMTDIHVDIDKCASLEVKSHLCTGLPPMRVGLRSCRISQHWSLSAPNTLSPAVMGTRASKSDSLFGLISGATDSGDPGPEELPCHPTSTPHQRLVTDYPAQQWKLGLHRAKPGICGGIKEK